MNIELSELRVTFAPEPESLAELCAPLAQAMLHTIQEQAAAAAEMRRQIIAAAVAAATALPSAALVQAVLDSSRCVGAGAFNGDDLKALCRAVHAERKEGGQRLWQ